MTDKEKIELIIDEKNELMFVMSIQGADTDANSVRLFCESDDMAYCFEGKSDGDHIKFSIPRMKDKLKENIQYSAKIEVVIENKHFVPSEFDLVFKSNAKIFVEDVKVNNKKQQAPIIEFKRAVPKEKQPESNIHQLQSENRQLKQQSTKGKQITSIAAKRMVDELLGEDV